MKVGVPRETTSDERRVAWIPETISRIRRGAPEDLQVLVESGAGELAYYPDSAYVAAGARMCSADELYAEADLILKVQPPELADVERFKAGAALVSFVYPAARVDVTRALVEKEITVLAMEAVPRITRAQTVDALSSMSTLAGYKAVLVAASAVPKILPMMVTAAGTIIPAHGLVLGAGVAGLQAIATARRLGAVMHAFDIRRAVKEQVESLGAKFLDSDLLQEDTETKGGYAKELSKDSQELTLATIGKALPKMDFVISTAQIPGRDAPLLINEDMVKQMRAGSVIVDLAAETGGNCALTEAGKTVEHHGVTIIGPVNLPASIPAHASQMYAKNLATLFPLIVKDWKLDIDLNDDVIRGMCLTHGGRVLHGPTREVLGLAPDEDSERQQPSEPSQESQKRHEPKERTEAGAGGAEGTESTADEEEGS